MSMRKCNECDGKGTTPCPIDYGPSQHPEKCAVCGGDRSVRVPCEDCGGKGKVKDD